MTDSTNDPHAALAPCLARIHGCNDLPVGAGLLVADDAVLTCAHVVNTGLERDLENPLCPASTARVQLCFPFCDDRLVCASVSDWSPPHQLDLAILRLTQPAPASASPGRLVFPERIWRRKFFAIGFPGGNDGGVVSEGCIAGILPGGLVQIESSGEYRIQRGFSGAPVWMPEAGGFIGLLVAAASHPSIKAGFMIPAQRPQDAFPDVFAPGGMPAPAPEFIPAGGAERLSSPFYIEREVDREARNLIRTSAGTTIAIRGPRQVGKSSLLSRVLEKAEHVGKRVAYVNLQSNYNAETLRDPQRFYACFFRDVGAELGIDDATEHPDYWTPARDLNGNGTHYIRYVLRAVSEPILLACDEADRLLSTAFAGDFFGMLRGWHEKRARDPDFQRLDLTLVISTETNALIDDPFRSPFNVARTLTARDFYETEVERLNSLHRDPFGSADLAKLYKLLGGHPYLTRRAMYLVAIGATSARNVIREATAIDTAAPFGEHLSHYRRAIDRRPALRESLQKILAGVAPRDQDSVDRLMALGLVMQRGERLAFRNGLYREYFQRWTTR